MMTYPPLTRGVSKSVFERFGKGVSTIISAGGKIPHMDEEQLQLPKIELDNHTTAKLKPYRSLTDEHGLLRFGKYEGKDIDDVSTEYLEYLAAVMLSDYMYLQSAINRRSKENLIRQIKRYPKGKDLFMRVAARRWGVTLDEAEVEALNKLTE